MTDTFGPYVAGLRDLPSLTFEIKWPPEDAWAVRARESRFCVTCYQEARRAGAQSLRATVDLRARRRWNRKRRRH